MIGGRQREVDRGRRLAGVEQRGQGVGHGHVGRDVAGRVEQGVDRRPGGVDAGERVRDALVPLGVGVLLDAGADQLHAAPGSWASSPPRPGHQEARGEVAARAEDEQGGGLGRTRRRHALHGRPHARRAAPSRAPATASAGPGAIVDATGGTALGTGRRGVGPRRTLGHETPRLDRTPASAARAGGRTGGPRRRGWSAAPKSDGEAAGGRPRGGDTILQKAVTPSLSEAYHGPTRPGRRLRRARRRRARAATPAASVTAHGLGFPGTPFSPDMPYIDVMRFEGTGDLLLEQATGGPDRATQNAPAGRSSTARRSRGAASSATPSTSCPCRGSRTAACRPAPSCTARPPTATSTYLATPLRCLGLDLRGRHRGDARTSAAPRQPLRRRPGRMDDGEVRIVDLIDGGTRVIAVRQDEQPRPTAGRRRRRALGAHHPGVRRRRSTPRSTCASASNGADYRVIDQYPTAMGHAAHRHVHRARRDLAEGLQLSPTDAAVYERELPAELLAGRRRVRRSCAGGRARPPGGLPSADRRPHGRDERGRPVARRWSGSDGRRGRRLRRRLVGRTETTSAVAPCGRSTTRRTASATDCGSR